MSNCQHHYSRSTKVTVNLERLHLTRLNPIRVLDCYKSYHIALATKCSHNRINITCLIINPICKLNNSWPAFIYLWYTEYSNLDFNICCRIPMKLLIHFALFVNIPRVVNCQRDQLKWTFIIEFNFEINYFKQWLFI